MKKISSILLTCTLLMALPLTQGCAVLFVGALAAGAAYGTVKYVNNTLDVTHQVSLDKAWAAANATLKELKMPVKTTKKDGSSGRLEARNAKGQPVIIQLDWKSEGVTQIQITVGTFESADNRAAADRVYSIMKTHL